MSKNIVIFGIDSIKDPNINGNSSFVSEEKNILDPFLSEEEVSDLVDYEKAKSNSNALILFVVLLLVIIGVFGLVVLVWFWSRAFLAI